MSDFKSLFNPLIKDVEGFREEPYEDINKNLTIGAGLNLNDEDVRGLMNLRGHDPEMVKAGQLRLSPQELDEIQDAYVQKREPLVRERLGRDLYETLQPHEKAAIMSMGYQSLNNIGPNLTGRIAEGDKIGAMREMILNTNKQKEPGILVRRLKEAELYGGPLDFTQTFQTMNEHEKRQVRELLNAIENENTRKEVLQKYGSYVGETQPTQFNKLMKLLKP